MRSSPTGPKVFGIGLNKTGTSTLGDCFGLLGLRHAGFSPGLLEAWHRGDLATVLEATDHHDTFADWPWPLVYEAIDTARPDSRFVLTRRSDPEVWLSSLRAHEARHPANRWRFLAYGVRTVAGHEHELLARYDAHLHAVRAHFRGRGDRFVELCWEDGDAWPELCAFVGLPVPDRAFPHANARPRSDEAAR